jgi:hypothetical protein
MVAVALICIVGLLGVRFGATAFRMGRPGVIIRRPNPAPVTPVGDPHQRNLAPLATVTVSSEDKGGGQSGEGVADGRPDTNEWSTAGEGAGAWITLTWDRPATVTEIDLYDRPSPADNVLSGLLSFDDGSAIVVRALPAGGGPEKVVFPPKIIRSVTFRIDQAQGRNAGLDEIMVIGTLN